MLKLVRQGTRAMVASTESDENMAQWIMDELPSIQHDLYECYDLAGPYQTVLHISSSHEMADSNYSFIINRSAEEVMEILINGITSKALSEDINIRLLPRFLFFRITGNPESVIDQIFNDFSGRRGKLEDLIQDTSDKGTAVLFTEKPLNRALCMQDIFEDILYINMSPHILYEQLQWRALSYFNSALEDREWNLVEIRIYDTYNRYQLHSKRLRLFLEAFEMGITVGEGWGKDYAHVLMPLQVFTMRILTFYKPVALKRALMGLEYSGEGNRFVDFDLYSNKRKIGWTTLSDDRNLDRKAYSLEFREEVMRNMPDIYKKDISEIEKEIVKLGEKGKIENKA
jgi:hypothetical protein